MIAVLVDRRELFLKSAGLEIITLLDRQSVDIISA